MTITPKPKPVKIGKKKSHFMKRGKKSSRQSLELKLDKIVREIVLLRDKFCVCPSPSKGHSSVMQCGHLVSRGKMSVRYSLMNTSVQCSSCNLLHEYYPERYTRWFVDRFGAGMYDDLCAEAETVARYSIDDLENLLHQLGEIHELQQIVTRWKPRFSQRDILTGRWYEQAQIEIGNLIERDDYGISTGTLSTVLAAFSDS